MKPPPWQTNEDLEALHHHLGAEKAIAMIAQSLNDRGRYNDELRVRRVLLYHAQAIGEFGGKFFRDLEMNGYCPNCGQTVDPDCCGCGSPREGHGDPFGAGHMFIPMGCNCGRVGSRYALFKDNMPRFFEENDFSYVTTPAIIADGTFARWEAERKKSK